VSITRVSLAGDAVEEELTFDTFNSTEYINASYSLPEYTLLQDNFLELTGDTQCPVD